MPSTKSKRSKPSRFEHSIVNFFEYLHRQIYALNSSKFFAGLMIIVLNIASRFVNIKLSKTMESYLKFTFSRQILIFAITWMGTRDIYIALIFSIVFILCIDFLFNEESRFCVLPTHFTDYHIQLLDAAPMDASGSTIQTTTTPPPSGSIVKDPSNNQLSHEEIKQAKEVLEKAKKQNAHLMYGNGTAYEGFYNIQ